LQALIEQINNAVADIPAATQRFSFDSLHGKLSMPAAGQLINPFGSRYGGGKA